MTTLVHSALASIASLFPDWYRIPLTVVVIAGGLWLIVNTARGGKYVIDSVFGKPSCSSDEGFYALASFLSFIYGGLIIALEALAVGTFIAVIWGLLH